LAINAIDNNPFSIRYLSKRLKNNKKLGLKALKMDPYVFKYIGKNLKKNSSIILFLIQKIKN